MDSEKEREVEESKEETRSSLVLTTSAAQHEKERKQRGEKERKKAMVKKEEKERVKKSKRERD